MHRRLPNILSSLLVGALVLASTAPLLAQAKPEDASPGMPKVGEMAPDFKLHYFDGNSLKDVSLADYRGKKNVIVAFYIFAFTGG
ncbi:MAG: hypothetical protein WBQ08_11200 [Candidatus Sulfotelmatobacter sp.]